MIDVERAREKRDRASIALLEKWLLGGADRELKVYMSYCGDINVVLDADTGRETFHGETFGDALAQAATVIAIEAG